MSDIRMHDSLDSRLAGGGASSLSSEELTRLKDGLAPFGEEVADATLYGEFLRFYKLDFSEDYPEAEYRCGLIPSGPFQLMTHRWLLPGAQASLLLVHGYFDHTGIYDKLIAYGLSRRCNVLIFDLPGHGLSSGPRAVIEDFADYGRAVQDVLAAAGMPSLPLFALGQSTGCAALMELAREFSWQFDKTVMLAPLVRPAGWFGVRAGHALLHRFTDSLERKFNRNSSDLAFLDFLQSDPLQCRSVSLLWIGALRRWLKSLPLTDLGVGPVLVIQGCEDGTVGWRYNMQAISQLFPGSIINYLPTAGHQLANESAEIRSDYYRVVDRYLFGQSFPD